MNTATHLRPGAIALLALAIGVQVVFAQAEKEVDVKVVVDAWNARRERGGTWRYVAEGENLIPKGKFTRESTEVVPPQDKVVDESFVWILELNESRIRQEFNTVVYDSGRQEFSPFAMVATFDGDWFYVLSPSNDKREGRSVEFTRVSEPINFEPRDFPVFFDRGVIPHGSVDARNMLAPIDPADFVASGTTTINGVECLVVRKQWKDFPAYEEFSVDATNDYRVLAWRRFVDNSLVGNLEIAYAANKGAAELSAWTYRRYKPDGTLLSQRKITVASIERDPEDVTKAAFTLEPTPEMTVMLDGGPVSTLKDDGTLVPITEQPENRGTSVVLILNLIALTAVCAAAAYWYLRRKKGGANA